MAGKLLLRGQSRQHGFLPAVTQAAGLDGAFLRMEKDLAGCAVYKHGIALANPDQGVFQSHDRTDVEGARQYGGMSGGAPRFGHDGRHLSGFQKAHLRRREADGEKDACFGLPGIGCARQVLDQSLADVSHIGGSLLEPGVVEVPEFFSQRQDSAIDGVFSGAAVAEDQGFHCIHE